MAKKANDIINVRVLEQDTCDQIRIGCSTPIFKSDIKNVVEALRKQYDKKLAWCGGFKAKGEEYYERIALVNADTLQSVAEVWKKGELW